MGVKGVTGVVDASGGSGGMDVVSYVGRALWAGKEIGMVDLRAG